LAPIGILDSGHGGLTVLRALADAQPHRPYVFLGDHGHAPYGPRDDEDIYRLTIRRIETLFAADCRLVVLACNTMAAVALRRLQQTWLAGAYPGRNVLGVLVPVVEAITRVPWIVESPPPGHRLEPRTVGIFATAATVASGSFPREIGKRAPDVAVTQQACPDLVPLIEGGASDAAMAPVVRGYVGSLLDRMNGTPLDTVVLGCTHYPHVRHLFEAALPPGVEILDQPQLVVRSLGHYLERHPEYETDPASVAPPRFLTTGDPATVGPIASRFYGRPTPFVRV
jgi:glutamate racemase